MSAAPAASRCCNRAAPAQVRARARALVQAAIAISATGRRATSHSAMPAMPAITQGRPATGPFKISAWAAAVAAAGVVLALMSEPAQSAAGAAGAVVRAFRDAAVAAVVPRVATADAGGDRRIASRRMFGVKPM